jgi:UDP-N-acetylglucosamine:LPS N-acetylglucosamine transferase
MYSNAKLVLARAGRNTISELLHLKIPSLLFATSCNIRGSEQSQNLKSAKDISMGQLLGFDVTSSESLIPNFVMPNKTNNNWQWQSGNKDLEYLILNHFA